MKLVLSPKGYRSNQFELGPEEIVISGTKGKKVEQRFPYWALSPSYSKHEDQKEKAPVFWGKIATLAAIPLLLGYYALEVGWGLWLVALPVIAIMAAMIFYYRKPRLSWLIYYEDLDCQFAFNIPYLPEEESKVLDFARAIERRLEEFKEQRSAHRKDEDGEDEAS